MLPITTHRSFHVPHTLAVAAALLAMIAAFGWNAQSSIALAQNDNEPAIDADVGSDQNRGVEHAAASSSTVSSNCSTDGSCFRDHGLLHLILPGLPSR